MDEKRTLTPEQIRLIEQAAEKGATVEVKRTKTGYLILCANKKILSKT